MPDLNVLLITFIISIIGSVIGTFIVEKLIKNKGVWLQALVFFFVLLISVTGAVWHFGAPANQDDLLKEYRAEFLVIRTDFENLKCYDCPRESLGDTDWLIKNELLKSTPDIIGNIKDIPDHRLDEGYVVLKYDLLGFLSAMHCELLDDSLAKYREAEKGLKFVGLAFGYINLLNSKKDDDDYLQQVAAWLRKDNVEQRLKMEKAWLKAVQFRLDGVIQNFERKEINSILEKISKAYWIRNPMRKNPSLKFFIL